MAAVRSWTNYIKSQQYKQKKNLHPYDKTTMAGETVLKCDYDTCTWKSVSAVVELSLRHLEIHILANHTPINSVSEKSGKCLPCLHGTLLRSVAKCCQGRVFFRYQLSRIELFWDTHVVNKHKLRQKMKIMRIFLALHSLHQFYSMRIPLRIFMHV